MTTERSLNIKPCVSVMMPCRNAGRFLQAAVQSVLAQLECLELLVADGGSTDGTLEQLEAIAASDPRLRIISRGDTGPADALNKAFKAARGTLIGWLNADDLYDPGTLRRAVAELNAHPEWLMVYGEADHIDINGDLLSAYPTHPPSVGINAFKDGCFICQPTVVFKRSMGLLLGPFNTELKTAFDFEYWLRAFNGFSKRIGYIPNIQAYSRLHAETITSNQRAIVTLEAMELIFNFCGHPPGHWLLNFAEELFNKQAQPPQDVSLKQHLMEVLLKAKPWLSRNDHKDISLKIESIVHAYSKEELSDWGDCSAGALLALLKPELIHTAETKSNSDEAFWQYILESTKEEYSFLLQDSNILAHLSMKPAVPVEGPPFLSRPFGVNLIGTVCGQNGIGEDLRSCAVALKAADVPIALLDFPPGRDIPQQTNNLVDEISSEGPYAFNLFCLTPTEIARYLMEHGQAQFLERFTIGYCPNELSQWPGPWLPLMGLVDELWASSHHIEATMQHGMSTLKSAEVATTPLVQLMPLSVEIPAEYQKPLSAEHRLSIRSRHQLPNDAVIFTFSFDLSSSVHRQNPLSALRAFERAFPSGHPLSDRVALVIKPHNPNQPSPEWQRLKLQTESDSRVFILDSSLTRKELFALHAACDAFISLHRAEGFGRGIAEALLLGLDVIATDYGGNTDFCSGPLAHPVRSEMIPVLNGQSVYHRGQHWAQASTSHASELMQEVATNRLENSPVDTFLIDAYRKRFDPKSCGARYRKRLEALWKDRAEVEKCLRWRQR